MTRIRKHCEIPRIHWNTQHMAQYDWIMFKFEHVGAGTSKQPMLCLSSACGFCYIKSIKVNMVIVRHPPCCPHWNVSVTGLVWTIVENTFFDANVSKIDQQWSTGKQRHSWVPYSKLGAKLMKLLGDPGVRLNHPKARGPKFDKAKRHIAFQNSKIQVSAAKVRPTL